jgi:hypothetical protein
MGILVLQSQPELYGVVEQLRDGAAGLLGDSLLGLYLGGSLAAGDFDPRSSDVDFLAVTRSTLDPGALDGLHKLHTGLFTTGGPWAAELEGSYIPLAQLNSAGTVPASHPRIERGNPSLEVVPHDSDWVIHRHVFREYGVALLGPPAASLLDTVTPEMLKGACRSLFAAWWEPMLGDPHRLLHMGYRRYAVQTMCRILYTIEQGTVVSKPIAAHWALEHLPAEHHTVIAQSLQWPGVERMESLKSALELIRYTASML